MIDAPKLSIPETLSPGGEPCGHAPSEGDPRALELPPDPLAAHYKLWTLYLVACSVGCILGSCLIWNATASLPLGLYWRLREPTTHHGDLVAFAVPQTVRDLVRARGYLPQGSLLVKPIAAGPGDRVCTRGDNLVINGEAFGKVLTADREGRPLPTDDTCGVLPSGQVYVASRTPGSFDSRTFGPVDVREVQARVVPLWTY